MSPANSPSPPMCCAMVKEETAVAEAKMPMSPANSTPRKPNAKARPRKIAGMTTRRMVQIRTRSRAWRRMLSKRKNAPNKKIASGLPILLRSARALSRAVGRVICHAEHKTPRAAARISGFLITSSSSVSGLTLRPLKASRQITASTLNSGTTTAVNSATEETSASSISAEARGRPMTTKLER